MIQGILTFQFILNETGVGEIEPEFVPIKLIFNNEKFTANNYSELIEKDDIFAIFYQHTTGVYNVSGEYSNYHEGRLKKTPFQVLSYFRHLDSGSQYFAISIFTLDDELGIFDETIKVLGNNLDTIFKTLDTAKQTKQISLTTNIMKKLEDELKFAIYQVDRLSNLDKLQKAALIFKSDERLAILNILREFPLSKREMRSFLETIKENPNIDLLLDPFLELNLIHRDWVRGKRDKKTGIIRDQGEFLFLTKDIVLARFPNETLLNHLKESNSELYLKYSERISKYFSNYDPLKQTVDETKKLASILLNPDLYDNFILMRNKFYPIDKIPKIFSEFVDHEEMLKTLKEMDITTEIKDENDRTWVFLLTDIKPLIIFPLYQLTKIKDVLKSKGEESQVNFEVARKALSLLELTYPETVEF